MFRYYSTQSPVLPGGFPRSADMEQIENFDNVENYMEEHDFLAADKSKVRKFLKDSKATSAVLTRTEISYIEKTGTIGRIARVQLGIQENFK